MKKLKKSDKRNHSKSTTTILERLLLDQHKEHYRELSITDLKHLNGSLYYLDFNKEYPGIEIPVQEIKIFGRKLELFEFPTSFAGKIDSKIFFHFKRKSKNLRRHSPKRKVKQG